MSMSKPLAGYKVIEIGHSIAAPYTGFILAELGAEVIKVESPKGGDYARGWGPPFFDGAASHFVALNRDKSSVTVDLSDDAERARLRRLILDEADAVICNLRAGVADRHGIGAAELTAAKPTLVYCEIGAFGSGGPLSDAPGYDPLMQAYGGIMSLTGESAERPPLRVGVSIVDMGAGFWGAIGILARLLARGRDGRGGIVETSLFETALAWATVQIASVTIAPRVLKPMGSGASGIVPYQAFCATDGWIVIGGGNDGLFAKLATALGHDEWICDPRFRTNADRVVNREVLIPLIEAEMAGRSLCEARDLLDRHGVPNAPVQRVDQVIHDAQTRALGILQEAGPDALATVGLPLRFDGERPAYVRRAPRLGEHTREVFHTDAEPSGETEMQLEHGAPR